MKQNKNTKNSKNIKAIAPDAGLIIDTRKAPPAKAKPVITVPAPAPVVAAAPPKPTVAMSPELRFFRETQATVNGWFMVEERGVLIRRRVYEWPRKAGVSGGAGQVYISNSGYCVLEMNEAGDGLRVPATWVPTMGKKAGIIATPAPAPVPVVVAPPAAPAKAAAPRSARKMKVA